MKYTIDELDGAIISIKGTKDKYSLRRSKIEKGKLDYIHLKSGNVYKNWATPSCISGFIEDGEYIIKLKSKFYEVYV